MEAPTPQEAETQRDPRRTAMGLSLAVAVLMLGGKTAAYTATGSAAILSDAAESVVHLFATAFAAFSLWYASTPADTSHPYGHGKIAYFAAGVEGVLVLVAAAGVAYSAVEAFVYGPALSDLGFGLAVIGALTLVNLALGTYLVRTGRRTNSLVLVSNGQHVLADMWTSGGVLAGVALVWLTGVTWLDPLVALLVALHLVWAAYFLLKRSVAGLMEEADAEATQAILEELERAVRHGVITNFHQVRHRRIGDTVWVECHLLFPGALTITEAHERSHAVEDALARLFPDDEVRVTAHLEPAAHAAAHPEGHMEPSDPLRDFRRAT